MPMEKEEFNKIRLRKIFILRFLFDNNNQAFTIYEIASRLGYQQKKIDIEDDIQWLVSKDLIYAENIASENNQYFMISEKGYQFIEGEKQKK